MSRKKIFLLDAFALIFRGYYAFIKNPRINSKGEDTSAIMGFMNSFFELIRKENPDYLAVAFDKGGSSYRREIRSDYKANRDATPEPISYAVPIIQEILKTLDIPIIEQFGVEADDLIGTLAKQAEALGLDTYMVTPDKDYAQLVTPHIFMYKPARMGNAVEVWGVEQVKQKFQVQEPSQVIDYLAMMGDAVDNIPGLPGVGDKTAKKFIAQFGSIEALLDNLDQLKGKLKEKIQANKELGLESKKLATIITDCDVTLDLDAYAYNAPTDLQDLYVIFDDLEFRRLKTQARNIFAVNPLEQDASQSTQKASSFVATKSKPQPGSGQYSLFDTDLAPLDYAKSDQDAAVHIPVSGKQDYQSDLHFYQHIHLEFGEAYFQKIIDNLSSFELLAVYLYDASKDSIQSEVQGISIVYQAGKGYYIPIDASNTPDWFFRHLQKLFNSNNIIIVGHQLKETLKSLKYIGVEVTSSIFDTALAHYLINPDMRHDLDILSENYLNYSCIDLDIWLGKGKKRKAFTTLDIYQQTQYVTQSADMVYRLYSVLKEELKTTQTLGLFNTIEIPLLRVLVAMEYEGIKIDVSSLERLSLQLIQELSLLEEQIYQIAQEPFNIASPKQLGVVLFEKLKLVSNPKKTKTGQYSTSEEVLVKLKDKHGIVDMILSYRALSKLKSTYVDALPLQCNSNTQRIHTRYVQTTTVTGRLSSVNPNLQNIPIRTQRGKSIRKCFIAKDQDHILLAADYSQIELRIIAALSQEDDMIKAFANKEDIHASTASKVFQVPIDEVTSDQRSHAKTVNFGIVYGVSAFGLSNQTSLSRSESKELIDLYYQTYPKLKSYMSEQVDFAREHGYVSTVCGRKRYLKNINSNNGMLRSGDERNAVNAPIQGSAADIIKLAMIGIHDEFQSKKLQSKMLLQVHDELVFEVYKPEKDLVSQIVATQMQNAFELLVPLTVDVGFGNNWLEAH